MSRIRDEPFLFVLALVALLIGLTIAATGVGSPDLRFIVVVIAILAFAVIIGNYTLAVLRIRTPAQPDVRQEANGVQSVGSGPESEGSRQQSVQPTPHTAPPDPTPAVLPETVTDIPTARDTDGQEPAYSGTRSRGRPAPPTGQSGQTGPGPHRLQLSPTVRRDLVNRLQACPSMGDNNSRDVVVRQLPDNIRRALTRNSRQDLDVQNIVDTCLAYPGGLERLVEEVRARDDGTFAMTELDVVLQRIMHNPRGA